MLFFTLWFFVAVVIAIPLYLLPTIIALKNDHQYKVAIIIVNILGGWFLLGWLVALVWCFVEPHKAIAVSVTHEIEKLHDLKEKGVITAEEFEQRKKKLLAS